MGFVFWLFLSNLIQILLLICRSCSARASAWRPITFWPTMMSGIMKNEHEIEVILHHLEHQNEIPVAMMQKLGGEVGAALSHAKRSAPP